MVRRKLVLGAAFAAATALTLSACGQSSGNKAQARLDPIKVAAILTTQSAGFGYPEMADAIKARAAAINATGGIQGRTIEVTVCNDGVDPTTAGQCARDAVAAGAVAVVGGITVEGDAITNALRPAGVAYITPTPLSRGDFTSPISFAIGGGSPVIYAGLGVTLVRDYTCRKIDTITSSGPGAQQTVGFVRAGIASAGSQLNGDHSISDVAIDFSTVVASVAGDGADCVALILPAEQAARAIPALRLGAPGIRIGAALASVTPDMLRVLQSQADNIALVDAYYPVTSDRPALKQFTAEMARYTPASVPDPLALQSWGAMNLLGKVLENIGAAPITRASILAELAHTGPIDSGVTDPELSFQTPNPSKDYPRVFNTRYLDIITRNSQYALVKPGFSDVAPVLKGL